MGLPQIMGFNYSAAGYNSASIMFTEFSISEENQILALGSYISNYANGTLLAACQSRDFSQMGTIYNGDGATYGPKLQNNAADYTKTLN